MMELIKADILFASVGFISISLKWQDVLSLGVALVFNLWCGLCVVAPDPRSAADWCANIQSLAGFETESVSSFNGHNWIAADQLFELL